jgi:hypothetical protein
MWADEDTVWLSGGKEDYNGWSDLVGDDTWKWENVQRRLKEASTSGKVNLGAFLSNDLCASD